MDERSANAYYDAQRAKGLGAAKFKRGLGYTPPESRPQLPSSFQLIPRETQQTQSIPPTPLPTPYMTPTAQATGPPYTTAYPYGYVPRPGNHQNLTSEVGADGAQVAFQ